jgi:hypothetical protein
MAPGAGRIGALAPLGAKHSRAKRCDWIMVVIGSVESREWRDTTACSGSVEFVL